MLLPSPIHSITLLPGVEIDVKRDDLIDPFISGNKWRKLKHHLALAKQLGRHHLVTFGGAWSNHLLATAAAAARQGFKATGYVRGEPCSNQVLFLCRMFGMELIHIDRDAYRDKRQVYENRHLNDPNTYFIDEGGAGSPALEGCAELIYELPQSYDHIFVAAGTGTTAAGLLTGIRRSNFQTQLHVVPVLKNGHFIGDDIRRQVNDVTPMRLHTDYHFGGYAKTTPELLSFISRLSANTGLLTDPVYTGKLFFAISDLMQRKEIAADARILAIHTGGLFGLFGKQDAIERILFPHGSA